MKRTAYLGCILLLAAATAVPSFAQDDVDAYTAFYNIPGTELKAKAETGEKFFTKFPTSQYAEGVYRQTVGNYDKLENWQKVIELAGKADQLFPKMEAGNKAQVYYQGMGAARQSNNNAQIVMFGEKVIAAVPDQLDTLMTLSNTIAATSPNDKAALTKAEGYAAKALTVVAKFSPKDNGLTDEAWAKQRPVLESTLHFTIGNIAYNNQSYEKAEPELVAATKLNPKDGAAWYVLGLLYSQQYSADSKEYQQSVDKTNKAIKDKVDQFQLDELRAVTIALEETLRAKQTLTIDTLATAAACGGATQQGAMTVLQKFWSTKNSGDMSGLPGLIDKKKQWLASQP